MNLVLREYALATFLQILLMNSRTQGTVSSHREVLAVRGMLGLALGAWRDGREGEGAPRPDGA